MDMLNILLTDINVNTKSVIHSLSVRVYIYYTLIYSVISPILVEFFTNTSKLAIMAMLASQTLLRENKESSNKMFPQ